MRSRMWLALVLGHDRRGRPRLGGPARVAEARSREGRPQAVRGPAGRPALEGRPRRDGEAPAHPRAGGLLTDAVFRRSRAAVRDRLRGRARLRGLRQQEAEDRPPQGRGRVHSDLAVATWCPLSLEGRGDLAMAGLSITPERAQQVAFSAPFWSGISEIVVTGPASPKVATADDLSGQEVFVRQVLQLLGAPRGLEPAFREGREAAGAAAARAGGARGRGPPGDAERRAGQARRGGRLQGPALGEGLPAPHTPSGSGRAHRLRDRGHAAQGQPAPPGRAGRLREGPREGHDLRQHGGPQVHRQHPLREARHLRRGDGEVRPHRPAVPDLRQTSTASTTCS